MNPYGALCGSIAAGGVAQIALKLSMGGRKGGAEGHSLALWLVLLRSGWFWLYAGCFGLATALWLVALSRLDISYAFPLLSLNYPLVALLARLVLREDVSLRRWAAIAVICCGVVLIAQS